jgi:aminoglycoside phosphotransferase (APT) family kinase protein
MATGPEEGLSWKPRASGNNLSFDGEAVVKDFGQRLEACARERACLEQLAGRLPVPALRDGSTESRLRIEYLDGVAPDEVIEGGGGGRVLLALGRFLRRLHELDAAGVARALSGAGAVIVHGDFGHHNVLMSLDGAELVAVLDWEEARLGDPITDLAWCEFQFRNRFERQAWAIPKLFEGYGSTPDSEQRAESLRARLEELSRRSR